MLLVRDDGFCLPPGFDDVSSLSRCFSSLSDNKHPQRKADKIRKQLIVWSIWGVYEDFETRNEVVYKFQPTF